jgi:hypothetical protein
LVLQQKTNGETGRGRESYFTRLFTIYHPKRGQAFRNRRGKRKKTGEEKIGGVKIKIKIKIFQHLC